MRKLLFVFVCLISPLTLGFEASGQDINKLSDSEKRLAIGSLYLSLCLSSSGDFSAMAKGFDTRQVQKMKPLEGGPDRYYDSGARAMVHLSKNFCAVEIATKEYDKFISSLPSILSVLGGKINMTKDEKGYSGILHSRSQVSGNSLFEEKRKTTYCYSNTCKNVGIGRISVYIATRPVVSPVLHSERPGYV